MDIVCFVVVVLGRENKQVFVLIYIIFVNIVIII